MAPNRVITACPIIAPRRFSVYTLYESAVIATGIHRFCLNHPALVLSQSTSVFPKTEPYWVPMHTARLSSGPHAYPILMVTSMRLKLYYKHVISQPATVCILANDVQVVTAPPYYPWAVKFTHERS